MEFLKQFWPNLSSFRTLSKTSVTKKTFKEKLMSNRYIWKRIARYICIPMIILCTTNVILHREEPQRPEFILYEHMRIRTKKFPWGDGNHTLFHNAAVNALPMGYEDIPGEEEEE